MSRILIIVVLFCTISTLQMSHAQNRDSVKLYHQTASLKTKFSQIKDQFNYGLVYSGPGIAGRYSLTRKTNKSTMIVSPELGFDAIFNKGIGLAWKFKPIDIFYGLKVNENVKFPLTIGAYITTNYGWQLYPYLQSGHMFWFSTIEAGPQFVFSFPLKDKTINTIFSTSAAGLTSRPVFVTEHTYYSLKFSDFIENVHRDQKFGSSLLFNHVSLEIELQTDSPKRLSFSYEFELFEYYKEPELSYLNHSINLHWKLGKQ